MTVSIKLECVDLSGLVPTEVAISRVPLEMSQEEFNIIECALEQVKARLREFIV